MMQYFLLLGAFSVIGPALLGFQSEQEFGFSIGFLDLNGDWEIFLQAAVATCLLLRGLNLSDLG